MVLPQNIFAIMLVLTNILTNTNVVQRGHIIIKVICSVCLGKRKCIENAHKVLKVLSDLLGHENQEVSDLFHVFIEIQVFIVVADLFC
jgi:hypothetical protein